MCSVLCSWAASSSSVNGRTWDRAHLTTEPPYAIQALVGFLGAFAQRLQNQRGCPTCSSPLLCFAAWCRARFHRRLWSKAGLACRVMRLTVINRSCANSPVCCRLTTPRSAPPHSKTASSICGGFLPKTLGTRCIRCRCFLMLWLDPQRRSPLQNPSTSVLRDRLVSYCSCLPSNPCPHVLSCH